MSARTIVTQGTKLINIAQSSKEMIAKAALQYGNDGAYTTARTVLHSTSILEFDFQVQRLNDTAALLSKHKTLEPLTREDLALTIATSFQHFDTHFPNVNGDRRVTLLLPNLDKVNDSSDADATPASLASHLFCHVEQLPPTATPPIVVEIRGQPRDNPLAKNAEWINERKHLEESRQNDVHEVVLSSTSNDSNGLPVAQAVEGTQTNLFVVTKDGTVRTAGQGVLEGTIRKMVIEECIKSDIPFDFSTPPEVSQLNEWDEMFLTSTSRLVLPVDTIRVPIDSDAYSAALRSLPKSLKELKDNQQTGNGNENGDGNIHDKNHDNDHDNNNYNSVTMNHSKDIVQVLPKSNRTVTNRIISGVKNSLMNDSIDVVGVSKDALRRKTRQKIRSVTNIDQQSKEIATHIIQMDEFINATGIGIFLSMSKNEIDTGYILSDLFHLDTYNVGVGGEYVTQEDPDTEMESTTSQTETETETQQRRKVYVPYVTDYSGKGTMEMLRVAGGWSEVYGFERNRWDIPEPLPENVLKMENALHHVGSSNTVEETSSTAAVEVDMDVVIVPCVAFDRNGRRCGHGGGFYDRFIEDLQNERMKAGQKPATLIGVALGEQLVDNVVSGKHDVLVDYVVSPSGNVIY